MRRKVSRFLSLIALACLALTPARLPASDGLTSKARMSILRGLIAEFCTVRVGLPLGEKGLELNSEGVIDKTSLTKELAQNGTAIKENTYAQITAIAFRDKEILFEINGGGKKKVKWTDRIEVGVGSRTTPITSPDGKKPVGSFITLKFDSKLPDLTVDQLKSTLAAVLDFTPANPLAGMNVPVPPEFKEAVEAKRPEKGMSSDVVRVAMGPPDRKVRETKDGVEREDWIYGKPPLKVMFITFEDDVVVDIQEMQGGVSGSVADYPEQPPR